MYKKDLAKIVAEKTGAAPSEVNRIMNATLETIAETLADGDKVTLIGFGTFKTARRSERTGRNIRTGETIVIPETIVPAFKSGKRLKDRVKR